MVLGRFERPLRRLQKNINRKFCSIETSAKLDIEMDANIKFLISKGTVRLENEIDNQLLDKWKKDYSIYQSSFESLSGNISFPIYTKELHELLSNSRLSQLIDKYFKYVYRKKPVLQYVPHVMITYPSISQSEFNPIENHFPAGWHIDYPYEFTVHIPIERITLETSHTKYIDGSQYYYSRPSMNIESIENNNNVIDCIADQGDVLCLDVEGWHRAQLEKNSYRAIIALKYTSGNDLLYYTGSEKEKNVIEKSIKSFKQYDRLREQFVKDLCYIESLNNVDDKFSILKDSKNRYKQYIEN